jgi:hypothetical protein
MAISKIHEFIDKKINNHDDEDDRSVSDFDHVFHEGW